MAQLPYASKELLRAALGKVSTADDALLQLCLDSATRFINETCGTRFDQVTETRVFDGVTQPSNRLYNGMAAQRLHVDDFVSISSLAYVYYSGATPQVIASTGYYPGPASPQSDWPYTWIDLAITTASVWDIVSGSRVFPEGTRTVSITGVWGWPSVPADIVMACVALAAREWKATKAGFSDSIGVDQTGTVQFSSSLPTRVKETLAHYTRGGLMVF